MIWYRHWLELRRPLLVLAAGTLAAAFFFAGEVTRNTTAFEQAGALRPGMVRPFGPLVAALGPLDVLALAAHAQFTFVLVLGATLILGATGVQTGEMQFGGLWSRGWSFTTRAVYYTLSLPVTRGRLIWTRLTAGCFAASMAFALALAAHAAVLAALGHGIPFGRMVLISLAGTLAAVLWLTVLGMLMLLLGQGWAVGLFVVCALVTSPLLFAGMRDYVATPRVPWEILLLILAVTTTVLSLSIAIARDEEF